MAANELITEYADIAAVTKNTDEYVNQVRRAKAAYDELAQAKIQVGAATNLKEAAAAAQASEKANKNLTQSIKDLNTIKKQEITLEKESANVKKANEQAAQAEIKTKKDQIAYEEALEKQKQKGLNQQAAEMKIAAQLMDEYGLLNKALRDAELRYKNLALTKGFDNEATQEALKNALETRAVLDKLDGNLRNHQRNVGNYKSAFDGLGFSFANVAREVPSLAVSMQTFFLAISNNLPIVFDEVRKAKEEITALREQGEKTPSMFQKITKSFFSLNVIMSLVIAAFTILGPKIIDAVSSLFGFADAEEEAAKSTERFIKAQMELIRTQKELKKLYEEPITDTDRLEDQLKMSQALGKSKLEQLEIERKIASARALAANKEFFEPRQDLKVPEAPGGAAGFLALDIYKKKLLEADIKYTELIRQRSLAEDEDEEKKFDKKIERAKQELDLYKTKTEDQQAVVSNNNKALQELYRKDAEIEKEQQEKRKKSRLVDLEQEIDITFELYSIKQQRRISDFKREIDDEKTHYLDKLALLDEQLKAEQDLINREEQERISAAVEKAEREKAKIRQQIEEEKEKENVNLENIRRLNRNIETIERNLRKEILIIEAEAADKSVENAQNAADKRNDIIKSEIDKNKEFYKEFQDWQDQNMKDTLDRYKKGLKEREDEERKAAEKRKQIEKEVQDLKVALAQKGNDFIFTLLAAGLERQRNINQQLKDEIDRQKDNELAANEARVQSEQDKAANIIIINSRAQQKKEELDRKNAELEIRKAKFQRAQQLFEIAINTIKAISEIKAKAAALVPPNPVLAPIYAALKAQALAQIPLVLLTSALSIASIMAKPIPRYFKGKSKGEKVPGGSGGGYAFLNDHPDGVTTEVHEHADGSVTFPKGRNTLAYVADGDTIHKDTNSWLNMMLGASHRDINSGSLMSEHGRDELGRLMKTNNGLLNKIANKPVQVIRGTRSGMSALWVQGSNEISYTRDNTNWNANL